MSRYSELMLPLVLRTGVVDNVTNFEESAIEIIKFCFGLLQLINKPTHIANNSSSCIDVIFTRYGQPKLVSGMRALPVFTFKLPPLDYIVHKK